MYIHWALISDYLFFHLGIGNAIENYLKRTEFLPVPSFTGHGIGQYFHGPPDIYPCK